MDISHCVLLGTKLDSNFIVENQQLGVNRVLKGAEVFEMCYQAPKSSIHTFSNYQTSYTGPPPKASQNK